MLLPRILAPARVAIQACAIPIIPSTRVLDALRTANGVSHTPALSFIRHASHQTQGRANGAKDGPGKRLGAKKSGGEYVIPGNIIFRQRGTAWYPGENCKMGRDHCIFANASGYVRYYRDPLKHPDRQYIGVVFEKHETLPYPINAVRRRRLNMLPVQRDLATETVGGEIVAGGLEGADGVVVESSLTNDTLRKMVPGKGYSARRTNWDIGRVGDVMKDQVKKFVPGDRFAAWRKSKARIEKNAEMKRMRTSQKAPKPKRKSR